MCSRAEKRLGTRPGDGAKLKHSGAMGLGPQLAFRRSGDDGVYTLRHRERDETLSGVAELQKLGSGVPGPPRRHLLSFAATTSARPKFGAHARPRKSAGTGTQLYSANYNTGTHAYVTRPPHVSAPPVARVSLQCCRSDSLRSAASIPAAAPAKRRGRRPRSPTSAPPPRPPGPP